MADSPRSPSWRGSQWRSNFIIRAFAILSAAVWRWNGDRAGQRPLLGRFAAHVALVLTFLIALSLSLVRFDSLARVASGAADLSVGPAMEFNVAGASPGMRAYQRDRSQTRITRRADPHTAIPSRPRLEIVTYRVQPGDTTESIAEQFGLDPTTIMWSNPEIEKAPDLLKVGQELVILPLDGVYHTVEEGDTLDDIVETYEVPIQEIVNCPFNNLPLDGELRAGTRIVVPGGTKPYVPREVTTYGGPVPEDIAGTGLFRWPASGYISQGYWYGHRAVDVANAIGAAILASDGGYVSFTGWTDVGYGYLVVLDHANGYRTYYAHLNDYFVVEGQAVEAGQVIGEMGSTGNSTGPHLHFEVRYNGYPTNPLVYLP